MAVLEQVDRWQLELLATIHPYLKILDVLFLSLILATLSYYVVERPALRLKRLVAPPIEPAPGEATAEPAPSSTARAPAPGRLSQPAASSPAERMLPRRAVGTHARLQRSPDR